MIFSALFHFVLDSMPHSVSKSVNISAHIFGWNIQTKSNIPFDWHFRYRVLSDAFPVRLPFQASCRPINNLYTENGVGISWAWGEQDCTQSRWGIRTAFRIEQNFHVRTLSVVLCHFVWATIETVDLHCAVWSSNVPKQQQQQQHWANVINGFEIFLATLKWFFDRGNFRRKFGFIFNRIALSKVSVAMCPRLLSYCVGV